jgi:hypothetical protein
MYGVDFFLFRQRYDAVDVEICFDRSFAFAYLIRFVGFEAMQA